MQSRDRPLTAAQRAYLTAFDAHLAAQTRGDRAATRARMSELFIDVIDEAGIDRTAVSRQNRGAGRRGGRRFSRLRRRLERAA